MEIFEYAMNQIVWALNPDTFPVTLQDRAQFFIVNSQDGAERNVIASLLLGLQFQVL